MKIRTQRLYWAAGAGAMIAACVDPAVESEKSAAAITVGASPELAYLGVLEPAATECPPAEEGWVVSHPSGPLARFCEYRFTPSGTHPVGDPSELPEAPLEKMNDAQLGMVLGRTQGAPVGAESSQLIDLLGQTLYPLFAQHADIPLEPALFRGARARLALVDSMPEGAPAPRSSHGPAMGAIARAAACAQGACAIEIVHHLALPRVQARVVDYLNGGYFGTLWELAQAIVEAVDDADAGEAPGLVINLSVGWDGTGGGDFPGDHLTVVKGSNLTLSAPERAVHTALVYARCSGALIFAATGNDEVGRGDRSGPLLPAGWAIHRAPSRAECMTMFGIDRARDFQELAPLLYPVGGVDHRDTLLENARPSSTPELVAPSSAVKVPGAQQILTGTSVGTVVASAAAALVWSIRPELGPDQVYELVHQSAIPLDETASFCARSSCGTLRRVSVCRAQEAACAGVEECSETLRCAPASRPPPTLRPIEMFLGAASVLLAQRPIALVTHAAPVNVPGCGELRLIAGSAPPAHCTFTMPIAARNLDSSPQPLDPMCPACSVVDRPEALWFMVDLLPEIPGDQIYEPYLEVKSDLGDRLRYELPTPLPEGFSEVYQFLPTGWSTRVTSAWLVYDLLGDEGRYAAGGPILVE